MATEIPLRKDRVLTDGASIEGGNENLIGTVQVDEKTEQAWGYGVEGERPEFVGVIKNVTIHDGTNAVEGDVLLANKSYHSGEGYEVQATAHTSRASGDGKPLPLWESQKKQSGNKKVTNPDYLAVYFVPDDESYSGSLSKTDSGFHASTTRQRE